MNTVNFGFLHTSVHFSDTEEPYLITDIPEIMELNNYPNELKWSLVTMANCVLTHVKAGVDVGSQAYINGLNDACETALSRGEGIIKEMAIKKMSGEGEEILLDNIADEIKGTWSKSSITLLAKSHQKAGMDLQARAYQVGLYEAFLDLENHVQQQRHLDQAKGNEFNADF